MKLIRGRDFEESSRGQCLIGAFLVGKSCGRKCCLIWVPRGHGHVKICGNSHGSNPGLLHCRQILHHLSQQGSPLLGEGRQVPRLRDRAGVAQSTKTSSVERWGGQGEELECFLKCGVLSKEGMCTRGDEPKTRCCERDRGMDETFLSSYNWQSSVL